MKIVKILICAIIVTQSISSLIAFKSFLNVYLEILSNVKENRIRFHIPSEALLYSTLPNEILKSTHQPLFLQNNGTYTISDINIFILFASRTSDISIAIENWKSNERTWNPQATVIVFISSSGDNLIKNIFQTFLSSKIMDIYVASEWDKTFMTWYPFDVVNQCGTKINEIVEISNRTTLRTKHPKNYNRCPLNLFAVNSKLFAYDSQKNVYTGLDAELTFAITTRLKLSPSYINSAYDRYDTENVNKTKIIYFEHF